VIRAISKIDAAAIDAENALISGQNAARRSKWDQLVRVVRNWYRNAREPPSRPT
jgi:hypothetical protein